MSDGSRHPIVAFFCAVCALGASVGADLANADLIAKYIIDFGGAIVIMFSIIHAYHIWRKDKDSK